MTELIMLVPTRGRPHNAARLREACDKLNRADTRIIFGVDADDPDLDRYRDIGEVEAVNPAGPGMVGALNQMAEIYRDQAINLGFMGDDHCPRTEGWDQEICIAIDEQFGGIAYGNDLIQGPNLPTAVVMDAWIPKTLGCMAPPALRHLYVDNVWRDWGRRLGKISYLPDVIIEHIHPLVAKAPQDARYEAVNSDHMYSHDHAAYEAYVNDGLGADVALLLEKLR